MPRRRLWAYLRKTGADAAAWPAADAVAVARRSAELQRLVEARVCAAPRGRYCLLGHRAAALLGAHPATADAAAFDLAAKDEAVDEGDSAAAARDSVGAELVKQKNDEVAAILSGTGGGAPASPAYRFAGGAADLSDKNDEIEAMLFGKPATDPNRVFETFGTASAASPKAAGALATWPEEEEEEAGAEGAWAGADAPTPSPPSFGDAGAPASPHAPMERTAVVAHMFVADYAEPDELSVFEGDTVAILEETEGWALVRDPSGAQGLVPLSYLHLNYASSPSGAWERQPSLTARYSRTKEDLLDDVFASAAAESGAYNDPFAAPSPRQPGTPGAFRRGASTKAATEEDAALFGGAFDYSAPAPTESLPRGASSRGHRQEGDAGSGGLLKSTSTASQHRRSASGGAASPLGTTSPRARPSSAESDGGKLIVAPFTAEMEGELSVAPGDKVQVHSDVDGWARVVRLADGRSGLVPSWAVAGA
ncbi:hypothetical protein QBZ16_003679 [Prototheca wickerhamii]|uniref:SH3 domain-containing protein n=1 Tax=Prototheca wickerhamii TaxID=3111 RepID=A0AAD9MHN4_PROWI|nr:hypothetical protein QBZ16_003679 [Prototheca wickerhamii]